MLAPPAALHPPPGFILLCLSGRMAPCAPFSLVVLCDPALRGYPVAGWSPVCCSLLWDGSVRILCCLGLTLRRCSLEHLTPYLGIFARLPFGLFLLCGVGVGAGGPLSGFASEYLLSVPVTTANHVADKGFPLYSGPPGPGLPLTTRQHCTVGHRPIVSC